MACFLLNSMLIWVCLILCTLTSGSRGNDEVRLFKLIMKEYAEQGSKYVRPLMKHNHTLEVKFGISLNRITDLDTENGVLSSVVWMQYKWKDLGMRWDPSKFGGVKQLHVPVHFIWTPDLKIYNMATPVSRVDESALAVVSYNGEVLWIPPAALKTTCGVDKKQVTARCGIKVGSWTYDGFKLDIDFYENKSVNLDNYIPNNKWEIVSTSGKKHMKYYPCCREPYPDIIFYIDLKRLNRKQ